MNQFSTNKDNTMHDTKIALKAKAKASIDIAYRHWHFDMQIGITIKK